MSDAPAPEEVQIEDVFAKLPLSDELKKLGTQTTAQRLHASDARKLVERMLATGLTDKDAIVEAHRLAKEIVFALPDDAMYDTVIGSMDLRPYLQTAIDSGWAAQGGYGGREQGVSRLLEQAQESAREQANDTATSLGLDPSDSVTKVQAFSPNVVGLSPAANVSSVETQIGYGTITPESPQDVADAAFDPTATSRAAAQQAAPTYPEDDLRGITGLPASGLDDAIQAEIDFNSQQQTPGVQRTGIMVSDTPTRNSTNGGTAPSGRKLSLLGARAYLNDLDVNELTDMQDKLAKAGYYDKIGQGPIKGELNDGATQTAWDLMLVDAYRTNTSIVKTMAKRGAEYRNTVVKRNEENMVRNWQGDTIAAANAMALDQIGRRLTDDEVGQVVSMVSSLRKDRSDDIIGVDNMSYQTAQTQQKGFDDSEVERKVDELVSGERSRQSSWDSWQAANKYFGVDTVGNPAPDKKANTRTPMATPQPSPRTTSSINVPKQKV